MACKSIITHIEAQARGLSIVATNSRPNATDFGRNATVCAPKMRGQQERAHELQSEVQRLRLAEGLSGTTTDRAKSQARINLLLREVDKCIALLAKAES